MTRFTLVDAANGAARIGACDLPHVPSNGDFLYYDGNTYRVEEAMFKADSIHVYLYVRLV